MYIGKTLMLHLSSVTPHTISSQYLILALLGLQTILSISLTLSNEILKMKTDCYIVFRLDLISRTVSPRFLESTLIFSIQGNSGALDHNCSQSP